MQMSQQNVFKNRNTVHSRYKLQLGATNSIAYIESGPFLHWHYGFTQHFCVV